VSQAAIGTSSTERLTLLTRLSQIFNSSLAYTIVVRPDQLDARLRWNMTASVAIEPE
jgi:hypothetical protein